MDDVGAAFTSACMADTCCQCPWDRFSTEDVEVRQAYSTAHRSIYFAVFCSAWMNWWGQLGYGLTAQYLGKATPL